MEHSAFLRHPIAWQAGRSSERGCTTYGRPRRTISRMWCCASLRKSSQRYPSCCRLPRDSASRCWSFCSRFLSAARFWRTPLPPQKQRALCLSASSARKARNTISWFHRQFTASQVEFSASLSFRPYARAWDFSWQDCRRWLMGRYLLIAAVLQVGPLVLIPAVIYMFAIASTTKAIVFLIWCIIVGLMDNVLKPLLLGRGVAVPIAVVFLGAIGGFMAMGIIGLFVGAVVLSVGYKLLLVWVEPATVAEGE